MGRKSFSFIYGDFLRIHLVSISPKSNERFLLILKTQARHTAFTPQKFTVINRPFNWQTSIAASTCNDSTSVFFLPVGCNIQSLSPTPDIHGYAITSAPNRTQITWICILFLRPIELLLHWQWAMNPQACVASDDREAVSCGIYQGLQHVTEHLPNSQTELSNEFINSLIPRGPAASDIFPRAL